MRFVLIDALVELEPGSHAAAQTTFPRTHSAFADHFPGRPVVPGTLLTEAMAQTGGWLLAATWKFQRWPLLTMIDHAKFRRLVEPDVRIQLTARVRSTHGDDHVLDAEARVGDETVATARLLFHAFDWTLADADRERFEPWARGVFEQLGGNRLLAAAVDHGRPCTS